MFTWTGFYAGVHAGYGFGRTDLSLGALGGIGFDGLGSNGWVLGAKLGYDWQFAQRWVAGLVVDGNISNVNSELSILIINAEVAAKHSYGVRGRLGYLISPETMVYGTAGWSWTEAKLSVGALFGTSENFDGLSLGAGFETRISGPWSLNAEYVYSFYKEKNFFGVLGIKPSSGVARVGLNYKFGALGSPTVYPAFATVAPASWTGFHVGAHLGYEFSNTSLSLAPLASLRGIGGQGVTGGLMAGYDWQVSPSWVVGVEADASLSNVTTTIDFAGLNVLDGKSEWSAAVRARAGYLFTPNTMVYGGVGYGWSKYSVSTPLPIINNSETFGGMQLAAGIETKVRAELVGARRVRSHVLRRGNLPRPDSLAAGERQVPHGRVVPLRRRGWPGRRQVLSKD